MTTKNWRALTYLPWLSLPLVLISNLILWNRLPANLAVHFDLSGAPNGWISKGRSLEFSLAALLLLLSFSTMRLIYKRSRNGEIRAKYLLRHCLAIGVLTIVMVGVLIYNIW
jgi:uncharacterized membrane protein